MRIIGTAGHVDHGKSALVRALTGTNPDRWIEEQLRGMTLDLGFARLRYADGTEAGIVDVPGHERFLHNMLAGAAGMELLLLVVAANDGPRQQTFEHLAILQYLRVQRTIVVLSKIDLIDNDERVALENRVRAELSGTIAAGAPLVSVSTVSGENLEVLREHIHGELQALATRALDAPPYLPVDRVFVLPGRGTILTGTLVQGRLRAGQSVRIAPPGNTTRIRSMQTFGETRAEVEAGARVALNVPALQARELARGAVVCDAIAPEQSTFKVLFRAHRPTASLLRRRNPVRAHVGSAEILGTLVLEAVPEDGAEMPGMLHLREPVVAFPGTPYVVRRVSPKTLLGGGTLAQSAAAPRPAHGDATSEAVRSVLRDAQLEPLSSAQIAGRANLREEIASATLEVLVAEGLVRKLARPPSYLDAASANEAFEGVVAALECVEKDTPWVLGATSLALAKVTSLNESVLVRLLASFVEDGALVQRQGYYCTLQHVPRLSEEQHAFFETQLKADAGAPFAPASLHEILKAVKFSAIRGLSQAFDTLLGRGAVVKVGDSLYRGPQIVRIRELLETRLRQDGEITMATFRDLLGTSRKFAVPLLEWFDGAGITVRSGDARRLRTRVGEEEPAKKPRAG